MEHTGRDVWQESNIKKKIIFRTLIKENTTNVILEWRLNTIK